ncbi:S-layer homology domain-containing protein [Paenibacillus sp. MMS20-IR301]|uniref:S-layer homology domain-containing protein n=1 Tax=Paenibacillus sp. MMS20-IR301 TaxID=2895946 RepID=UPI0028E1D616|nr:S-layer homology domain-containing protein [Paenibacillus sp. MMS20-IR301]WNS42546.1 S-layer homology domain-containing protein [Paenibacillus sp. MMS20-IR301]
MTKPNKLKKLLSLFLAASLVILPVHGAKAEAAVPETEAFVNTAASGGVSHYNYFNNVYGNLQDENHVFKTATYEDIVHLFESEGNYAVLVGGAWSEDTQADIGFINEVAKKYGVSTIYNFDTRLDGAELNIADSNNKYAYKYVDLVNKYLKNLALYDKNDPAHNVSYVNKAGETVSANKIEAPFLFVYNKDHKDSAGNSAPVVAYLNESRAWSDFQTGGSLDPVKVAEYKALLEPVFSSVPAFSTINESEYIKAAFNTNYLGENPGKPAIFTEGDESLVYEHVTYHQLKQILASEGSYAILFGGSWCPNTQAIIKYINEYAKKNNVDKIYFFDTKLDSGVNVAEPKNNSGGVYPANPHGTEELQIRSNDHLYTKLYVDLVKTYLTNIKTENNTAAKPNVISYTDGSGVKVTGDRLQVPYFFTYNKSNKDASGNSAPILGHVELMYSWTNIQPDFVDTRYPNVYPVGVRYTNAVTALNAIYSRLESVPSGLSGVAPTSAEGTDGQITGTGNKTLEYKALTDNAYTAATGEAITGLAPGTYSVRYVSKPGYQGPITATGGAAAIAYAAGESVNVVVPEYTRSQPAPSGLQGIAPTTEANLDGQITGASAGQEYKLAQDTTYQPVTGPIITGLIPGIYQVRYPAKEGYSVSPVTEIEVPAYGEQAAPTGLAGIAPTTPENKDGRITGTTPALEFKLSTVTEYVYATDIEITGLIPGTYEVRFAAKEGFNAGRITNVVVPAFTAEQAAPTGLAGIAPTSSENNNGRITGTTTAQEYKPATATSYVYAPDKEITGLAPGTYHVRYSAKEGYKAGAAASVVVPAYTAPSGDVPSSSGSTPAASAAPSAGGGSEPVTTTAGATVTVSVTAAASTDESTGVTTAAVTADALAKLAESGKQAEAGGKKAVLEIKVETKADTQTAELRLPRSAFNALASGTKADLKVNYLNVGSITLDARSVASISGAADSGDIHIRIAKVALNADGKAVLGDRPVYDLAVTAGDSRVTTFGGGKASISVPYTLAAGEESNSLIVYYITESGSLETIRGGYSAAAGGVNFVTPHFSQYIIGYNKVEFTDVTSAAWYNNAVSFLAARGITSGTDGSSYSPNTQVTRGQFIVLLLKAYGISPEAGGADNFTDAGSAYYSGYLAAAKKLNIATGSGDNQFKPDNRITRQELFTLLYRALSVLGELPGSTTAQKLSDYSDAPQVAGYAGEALQALVERGVIEGDNGRIHPLEFSTRAEAAQVIYNLLSE